MRFIVVLLVFLLSARINQIKISLTKNFTEKLMKIIYIEAVDDAGCKSSECFRKHVLKLVTNFLGREPALCRFQMPYFKSISKGMIWKIPKIEAFQILFWNYCLKKRKSVSCDKKMKHYWKSRCLLPQGNGNSIEVSFEHSNWFLIRTVLYYSQRIVNIVS